LTVTSLYTIIRIRASAVLYEKYNILAAIAKYTVKPRIGCGNEKQVGKAATRKNIGEVLGVGKTREATHLELLSYEWRIKV